MEKEKNTKGKQEGISLTIALPEGVEATITEGVVTVKKQKQEISKRLLDPAIRIDIQEDKIIISAQKNNKRNKKMINTFTAHIKNMMKGAEQNYQYVLKVCSGHFPITVSVEKDQILVKNFFGEKIPRSITIKEGVSVKVEGDQVMIDSPNKELASQVAADLEQLTRRSNFDTRIFQDGIYLIKREGKDIK